MTHNRSTASLCADQLLTRTKRWTLRYFRRLDMQNLITQQNASLIARALTSSYLAVMIGISLIYGCGAPIPLGTSVPDQAQNELGPILGPITKEKVIDRLKGYPVCGMQSEEQKLTLQVRTYPLAALDTQVHLVQIECFFFGVQGLYEFALINPKDGKVYPLAFQGMEPVKSTLQGLERRSPVALNKGRSEVCGVPDIDPKSLRVSVTCKGDPSGGCGAYARYKLAQREGESFDPKMSYFKLVQSKFHSCAQMMIPDQSRWSDTTP